MLKTTLLAAAAILALAAPAKATTIDILLGSTPSSSYTYSQGGAYSGNVDLTSSGASLNQAAILAGNVNIPNFASAPSGTLLDNTYVAVFANGSATFSLGSSANTVGLTWGSIDSYNSLILTASNGNTYTITGTEILNYLSTIAPGQTQANVVIQDPFAQIVTAELTSSSNSFEAANLSTSSVPLPASALLFSMALAGLFLVHRRRVGKA